MNTDNKNDIAQAPPVKNNQSPENAEGGCLPRSCSAPNGGIPHDNEQSKTMIEIKNAVIKSARISCDRDFLDCWLDLDYGGCGQGFGGYCLYLPKSWTHHKLESVAGHFIFRVMEIAEVTDFDKLQGKTIRVKGDYSGIEAIGNIVKDDWFCPREDFKKPSNEGEALPSGQNDIAHRHGGEKPCAAEQARKLQEAVEATHDAVFGAAPCSPLRGKRFESSDLDMVKCREEMKSWKPMGPTDEQRAYWGMIKE